MAIVKESVGIQNWGGGGTQYSAAKPSGLAVGDLMVALGADTGLGTVTLASGWTLIRNSQEANTQITSAWKIAVSADVAASSITWASVAVGTSIASIVYRISGANPVAPIGASNGGSIVNTAAPSLSGATPNKANSLFIQGWSNANTGGSNTISGYAIVTSNPTWNEDIDTNTSNFNFASASALRPEATASGNFSASGGGAGTDWAGQIIEITPLIAQSTTISDTVVDTDSASVLLGLQVSQSDTIIATDSVSTEKAKGWDKPSKSAKTWNNTNK